MAAGGDVIQSFMVGLGFEVDQSSLAAFNSAIQKAALRVTALYGAVNAFAGSMVFAFAKISEGFEELGYQYHLIAPAINKAIVLRQEMLKAYGAAGINIRKVIVDSVKLNMSLAKTKFAMEAIYKSVGSKFFGLLQKQSDSFRKKLYENMPYIISALEKLVKGVFFALNIATQFGTRLWEILSKVYNFFVDLDHATAGWSTRILGIIAIWKLLNLSFLATPLGALIAGFIALVALYDDFKVWREGGQSTFDWGSNAVKTITGIAVALGGLIALWKGFSLVMEGVKIVTEAWGAAVKAVSIVSKIWAGIQTTINFLVGVFDALLAANPIGLIVIGVIALVAALVALDAKWGIFGGHLSGFFAGVGKTIYGWFQGIAGYMSNILSMANPFSALGDKFLSLAGKFAGPAPNVNVATPPLAGGGGSNNINAKSQTDITIVGAPNADLVGRQVEGIQNNVNRDLVRNMKGVVR